MEGLVSRDVRETCARTCQTSMPKTVKTPRSGHPCPFESHAGLGLTLCNRRSRALLCAGSKKGQENVDPSQPCQPSPLARIGSHLVSACTRPKTADGDAPSLARSLRELNVLQKKQSHQVPGTCGLTRSMPSSPHLTARADVADDTSFSSDKKPSVFGALPQCQVCPL